MTDWSDTIEAITSLIASRSAIPDDYSISQTDRRLRFEWDCNGLKATLSVGTETATARWTNARMPVWDSFAGDSSLFDMDDTVAKIDLNSQRAWDWVARKFDYLRSQEDPRTG